MAGETQVCTKCGVEYPATPEFFYARKEGYLRRQCKKCVIDRCSENAKVWLAKNPGKSAEYTRRWKENHPDHDHEYYLAHKVADRARSIRFLRDNPEKSAEYSRRYREKYPEKSREQWASYYENNRDYEIARSAAKSRRLRESPGSYTEEDVRFIFAYQDGRCFYCLDWVGEDFHRDHHIPISKGGTNNWTNIVVSCPTCNLKKGSKMPSTA